MNTDLSERCLKGVQKSRPILHFNYSIKTFVLANTDFRSISFVSYFFWGRGRMNGWVGEVREWISFVR